MTVVNRSRQSLNVPVVSVVTGAYVFMLKLDEPSCPLGVGGSVAMLADGCDKDTSGEDVSMECVEEE